MANLLDFIHSDKVIAGIETAVKAAIAKPKVRKAIISVAAALLILQIYFVRELLAAELLFGLVFVFWLVLAALIYAVGTIGEHGLEWGERALRFGTQAAKRTYAFANELAKKSMRHPESAQ